MRCIKPQNKIISTVNKSQPRVLVQWVVRWVVDSVGGRYYRGVLPTRFTALPLSSEIQLPKVKQLKSCRYTRKRLRPQKAMSFKNYITEL